MLGVTKINNIHFSSLNEARDANIRRIITSLNEDVRIIIIKLCDRLDNVKDLVNSNSSQFMSRYINETLEIFNFLIFNRELDDEEYELVREILNNVKNLNNNYVRKLKIA